MKVYFTRTGGFAGITLTVTLDTERLPPEEADRFCQLIAAASFFDQPPSLKSHTPGADRCQYRVTVEEGERRKQVEMDDPSVPESFRPFLEYLIASARTARKEKG